MNKKIRLSPKKRELYKRNGEIVTFLRNNPIIALNLLLGIELLDSQKYVFQMSWNTDKNCWTCSRSFGKSFMLACFGMLKMLLYPNLRIYLISSVGSQAQETFMKLEDIAKQRIESIPTLRDIFLNEIEASSNSDGFIHDKASFKVGVRNDSKLFTLNSIPDNIRGKRSNLNLYDESSFCSVELIEVTMPFTTQNSEFKNGVDDILDMGIEEYDADTAKLAIPNQIIFASSAGEETSTHFEVYNEYGLKMIAGDSRYFVADIPCDIPLKPMKNGEFIKPLLTQSEIDDAMDRNPQKAMREYFNKFQREGGEEQPFKLSMIKNNETFQLPQLCSIDSSERFAIAFDPARTGDNSVVTVMKIIYDEKIGYYGKLVNCINFLDTAKKQKMQLRTPLQIKELQKLLLNYNGNNPDYMGVEYFAIDPGAGGGGKSAFADNLLDDWYDEKGTKHKGLIDKEHETYREESRNFPNASNILQLVSPQKFKSQMGEELEELLRHDLIKFPKEYGGRGIVNIAIDKKIDKVEQREIKAVHLSQEQQIALVNLDILKSELTSIHKINDKYILPKNLERKMHDDRFYTLLLLGHYLYEIRRKDKLKKNAHKPVDLSQIPSCVSSIDFKI